MTTDEDLLLLPIACPVLQVRSLIWKQNLIVNRHTQNYRQNGSFHHCVVIVVLVHNIRRPFHLRSVLRFCTSLIVQAAGFALISASTSTFFPETQRLCPQLLWIEQFSHLRRRQNFTLNPMVEFLTSAQTTTARHHLMQWILFYFVAAEHFTQIQHIAAVRGPGLKSSGPSPTLGPWRQLTSASVSEGGWTTSP